MSQEPLVIMCARNDRSKRTTSSSNLDSDRRQRSSSRPRSSPRARSMQRRRSTTDSSDDKHRRSRSTGRARASTRTPPKQEYDCPFDVKGRCHYHPDTQLARKKLTGGWKVILDSCPKCVVVKSNTYSSDNSSTRSRGERSKSPYARRGDHKSSSRSVCDDRSVGSRHSNTTKSTRSSRSVSPGRKKVLPINNINRNEETYPFDDKGYCHRHANVRLAKRKFTGGWKILLDRCHACIAEKNDSRSVCSRSSRRSRSRSVCSRSSRHSCSKSVSSRSSHRSRSKSVCSRSSRDSRSKSISSRDDGRHRSRRLSEDKSTSKSSNHKKKCTKKMSEKKGTKKMSEKKSRIGKDVPKKEEQKDEVVEFENSYDFERLWENERRKATPSVKAEQGKDDQIAEYVYLRNTPAKLVKDLPFIDLKGDAGKYTGEVNDKLLPHGQGCLTYDHGLVQEGNWTNGFIDDDF